MLTVWALTPANVRKGMLDPTSATAVVREMGVDTFVIEVNALDELAQQVGIDWKLIIDDSFVRVSGRITEVSEDIEAQQSTKTLTGVGELYRLRDRLVYPNPAKNAGNQDVARYVDRGRAETVLKKIVSSNAGGDALPERQSPWFIVPVSSGRGDDVSISERFSNLLDVAKSVARAGGITFSADLNEKNEVVLNVRAPSDLSRQVRFVAETGGAATGSVGFTAPTVTAAIVAGQGEGAERYINEVARPGNGRRIEVLKDRRDTDETDVIQQAAEELLNDGAETGKATLEIPETPDRRFGQHFKLGDIITVQLGNATVSKPVRSAEIEWDGYGRTVKISVGDHENSDDNAEPWVKEVKDLYQKVHNLESNK